MTFTTASELGGRIEKGESSPEEVMRYYLDRIQKYNPVLNAYIKVERSGPDGAARNRRKGKLYGLPIAIKDNICVKGWEITCASKILKGFISPYDATVIERLLHEGAILIGRSNMDEFAFGSSCETSCYGPTKNPWDIHYSPGGSSGGSAAVVAADLAAMALGSDTGGSIRQPASFCGIVGMKPTYGRVSRYGLVAFGSSLDQIGPLTRSVEDAAKLLSVIAGFDPKDSTSADREVPDYERVIGASIKGMRLGIPKEFFGKQLSGEFKTSIRNSIRMLEKEGAECIDVSLPHTDYAVPVYYVIAPSEASSNLGRFDGVKYGSRDFQAGNVLEMVDSTRQKGFGQEAKRRILLGTYALSSGYYDAFYLKAMKVRKKMIEDFQKVFQKVECIVTPTSPTGSFKLGEKSGDPLSMYLSDVFTISANLAGIPAISVPCGLTRQGLPMGIQFMGKPFEESTLFKIAYVFQEKIQSRNWTPKMDFA